MSLVDFQVFVWSECWERVLVIKAFIDTVLWSFLFVSSGHSILLKVHWMYSTFKPRPLRPTHSFPFVPIYPFCENIILDFQYLQSTYIMQLSYIIMYVCIIIYRCMYVYMSDIYTLAFLYHNT